MKRYLKFKEPVSTWTHLITCLCALAGLVFLIVVSHDDVAKMTTMIVYGVSMVVLYLASSLYHAVHTTPKKELWLKKFDHASIFFLIAGSYTPVLYFGLDGTWRLAMLICVWTLAILGMLMKTFFIHIPNHLSTALYVGLGWIAVVPFVKLIGAYPLEAILLLLGGGIAYTIGAVIYAKECFDFIPGKFGHHEVFHLWVMAGSGLHFTMVARYIA